MRYQLKLKGLRKAAGFATQKAFADYLGIKERKYASWERGEVGIPLEDAFMLCEALKCTPNDLCGFPSSGTDERQILSADEREIVDNYRDSSPQWQLNITMTAKAAASESRKE